MKMKKPNRKPRNEPSLEKYTYYDHENVVQDDGITIINFTWNNKEKDKGWQFSHFEDSHGFRLLSIEEQTDDYAQLLMSSSKEINEEDQKRADIAEDEIIFEYSYGAALAGRGGFFVKSKTEDRVLRCKGTWIS